MESMTGYGESRFTLEGVKFHFRIRSLNSRYLETEYHLPSELAWFEPSLEDTLKGKFSRGKVQVYLDADRNLPKKVSLDKSVINSYKTLFQDYYKKRNLTIPLDVLVQIPSIFEMKNTDWKESEQRFEFYFLRALLRTQRMRIKEGKKIKQWMRPRIRLLMRYNQKVSILTERSHNKKGRQLRKRFNKMKKSFSDKDKDADKQANKMWLEIKDDVLNYFQSDISEEIERLNIHLPEVLKIITKEEASGKKLEFYFQELLREVNTFTSKTADVQINQIGIQMKIEIEKLREQVRNVA